MTAQDIMGSVEEEVIEESTLQLLMKFINKVEAKVEAKADADRAETKAHLDGIMAVLALQAPVSQPSVGHVGVSRGAPLPELVQPPGGTMLASLGMPPHSMATLMVSSGLPPYPSGMPNYTIPPRTSHSLPTFPGFQIYPNAPRYSDYLSYINHDCQNLEQPP